MFLQYFAGITPIVLTKFILVVCFHDYLPFSAKETISTFQMPSGVPGTIEGGWAKATQ